MASFASAKVIGRVGKDPAIHAFEDGNKVAEFSIATNRRYTAKDGQKVETTFWHRVKIHNRQLIDKILPHIHGGDPLYAEGDLVYETFTDKNGVQRKEAVIEIRFNGRIELLPNGRNAQAAETNPQADAAARPTNPPAATRTAPAADQTPLIPGPSQASPPAPAAPWN